MDYNKTMKTEFSIKADWDPKVVYDDSFLYSLGKNYNGYNYMTMRHLHFTGSQFIMTLAAINKLSKLDETYKMLAEKGNVIKDELYAILTETASWTNKNAYRTYGAESNHYKNIRFTLDRYDGQLSAHDKLVLRDIPKDIKYTMSKLVQFLTYIRDSEFESGESNIKDLPKLAGFIEDLIRYLEILHGTKIAIPN